MTSMLTRKRQRETETHREEGRECSKAASGNGNSHQKLEEAKKRASPGASGGNTALPTTCLQTAGYRAVGKEVSIAVSHPVVW